MKAWFYTDQGPTRQANQDGLFLAGTSLIATPEPVEAEFNTSLGLFAVIDGMGGVNGGELATATILEGMEAFAAMEGDCAALERGLLGLQRQVAKKSAFYPYMGAALAGIWLNPAMNLAFNCGDCRVYRSRSGYLEKITHDHSLVQELVDAGGISEEEARLHPRKNVLTAAISADDPDPQIYCRKIDVKGGDQFLLCSDGLWECLSLEEMEEIMGMPPEEAAKEFREAVWTKNARDNVSFIIMTFD